jgi:4-amino-4-deoxy-L-arabinose transferase-like glycosyltransferase
MPIRWRWITAYVLVALIAVVRIAATHHVYSETMDEPVHIVAGFDWLTGAGYGLDPSHPPLERILSALPAAMERLPPPPPEVQDFVGRGNTLLYALDRYEHNLAHARWGNLLLFLVGIISVCLWAQRLFGRGVALLAMALFASLPPILGHAGLATTDLAVAATIPLALLLLERWLDRPTLGRGAALGLGIGLGLLSKFSFVLFFPLAVAVVGLVRWLERRRQQAAVSGKSASLAIGVAFLVVWGGYRFDVGTIKQAHPQGMDGMQQMVPKFAGPTVGWMAERIPVPAPLFIIGVAMVKTHDKVGHTAYLLGQVRQHGWWYYFPVLFFYKTPLPFLILCAWGLGLLLHRAWRWREYRGLEVALIPIALLLAVMPSSINIGIRHILPIYAPLAIVAAHAAIEIWRRRSDLFGRVALAGLLVWLFVGVGLAHPDYLPWFNEAAGGHPEEIAVDSNLDWGQDVLRLVRTVRTQHIDHFWILYFGNADLGRHHLPAEGIEPWMERPGWYVVSETVLHIDREARRGAYNWLVKNYKPVGRIGKSMLLYHVPG